MLSSRTKIENVFPSARVQCIDVALWRPWVVVVDEKVQPRWLDAEPRLIVVAGEARHLGPRNERTRAEYEFRESR